MKKKLITIFLIVAAVCALGVGAIAAHAENGGTDGDTAETLLFLPSSYEQYLELENPSDFAVNERYIAVADGTKIYLFDKSEPEKNYQVFNYTNGSSVTCLDFYSTDGRTYLYFTSEQVTDNPILYIDCDVEDLSDQEAVPTRISSCSEFIIHENTVCYITAQNAVYLTQMDGLDIAAPSGGALNIEPYTASFNVYNDTIYFSKYRSIYSVNTPTVPVLGTVHDIDSFAFANDVCYYVSEEGYFYLYDAEEDTRLGSASSIKLCDDGSLYLLQNNSIKQYLPQSGLSGYEIGKYSNSANRIGQNASDISVNGNRIAIADTANSRVLIAEKRTDGSYVYSQIQTDEVSPTLVCAGESSVFISDGSAAFLYSYSDLETPSAPFQREEFSGTIYACTYSYGTYYIVTSGNQGAVTLSEQNKALERYDFSAAATSITSDIYGNLYLFINNAVYRYSPEEFISNGNGTLLYAFVGNSVKLLSDFAGNIYAQTDDGVYLLSDSGNVSVFTPSDLSSLVYYGGTPTIASFAFGFENGDVYILSDGFIAVTRAVGISSLDSLDATGVYDSIIASERLPDSYSGLKLVTVPANSVAISLNVSLLTEDTAALPYSGYERTAEEKTGVVLADTGDGLIVGFFDAGDETDLNPVRTYQTALVLGIGLDYEGILASSEYLSAPDAEFANGGYAVESVGVYRFPQMGPVSDETADSGFLRFAELPKNTSVRILQKIRNAALDSDYYYISADINGETVCGYVPASFISAQSGAGFGVTEYRFARLDKGESVTLYHTGTGVALTLSSREELKIYDGNTDENGNAYAVYEDDTGTYAGYIDPNVLYEATPVVLVTLVLVTVAAAAIILSVCYLLLRKQPTLQ